MRLELYKATIKIPENVSVEIVDDLVIVKGPKGEVKRSLKNPRVKIEVKDSQVIISSKNATKKEKTMIGTFESHIKNMIKGVREGVVYKLKICSGHFPMTVSVEGKNFVVKNFFGERVPRVLKLKEGVNVKVEGDFVIVDGADIELVSQTSADIEQLCRITNRDRRIFQDGIYIIDKDGQQIE